MYEHELKQARESRAKAHAEGWAVPWEEEEKAVYTLEFLTKDFHQHLYGCIAENITCPPQSDCPFRRTWS